MLVQIATRDAGQKESAAREARRDTWASLRPRAAHVYVENRCHLKCEHCYESEESHPPAQHGALSVDEYADLFDELASLGVLYLTLSGGEIFLRRDLFDIVAEARKRRFAVTLFTSGTHINEAKADRIAELKVTRVEITIYSHDPEVHDRFTGAKGSWARSVRALELLAARGVQTKLKFNLMTFNVDHIDDIIALAERVGADWQFDPTVKPKLDGDRSPLRFAVPPDEIRRKVLSRPDLYAACRKHAPEDLCSGQASLLGHDDALCGAGRSHLAVGAAGELLACGFFAQPFGSLKEGSLTDQWLESQQLDAVRQATLNKMTSCPSCELNTTCSPCMAYSAVEHDGDMGQCASDSRQFAEAVHGLTVRRVDANRKMSAGRSLPLLGNQTFEPPPAKPDAINLEP